MTSVSLSAGPIHVGLDTSKNAILVGILRSDEVSPDTEKIFNDEASVRRLIDRFDDRMIRVGRSAALVEVMVSACVGSPRTAWLYRWLDRRIP
jgi:hypothetical protein